MAEETPVNEVLDLIQSGMSDAEIIRRLTDEGFSPVQISDALNQAKIKQEIAPEGLTPSIMTAAPPPRAEAPVPVPRPTAVPRPMAVPPAAAPAVEKKPAKKEEEYAYPTPYVYPAYPTYPAEAAPPAEKIETEVIEEIAEEIVNEKWLEIKGKISDVIEWKAYAEKRMGSLDERLKRIELSLDRLQAALLAKVQEYGRDVKDLGAEMASLESAFGKILSPLIENVKELSKITEDLKGKEKPKKAKNNK